MQNLREIPPSYVPNQSYGLFIDNQWVNGESGETFDGHNSTSGKFHTCIPNANAANVIELYKLPIELF